MANASDQSTAAGAKEQGDNLLSVSFVGLLFTQLLTAINDNIFRWLVIGVGKDYVDPSNYGNILMAGTACFVLPYLLLAAPAGYLADRYSKRTVIIACKLAEIIIMALGVVAIVIGNIWFLFAAVALMGGQSALFSPSKLGSIPEMLKTKYISAANGIFGLATVSATVIGMGVGSWLSDATGFKGQEQWPLAAGILIGVAGVGFLLSLLIDRLQAANPQRSFPWNLFSQTIQDLRTLARNKALLRVALGIVFFWSLGALSQLNIDQFAFEGGALNETDKLPLLYSLVFGVGLGSVLAGIWSGGHVELGILPLGAILVATGSILLFTVSGTIIDPGSSWSISFIWASFLLFILGCGAGLFQVPLEAFMQHRSPLKSRGAILAAANFMTFSGILVSALLFAGFRTPIFAGSLDNIDSALLGDPVSAESKQKIADLESRFGAAWKEAGEKESPPFEEFLAEAEPNERKAALSRLLWIEFRERLARGDLVNKYDYFKKFQDEKLLVKSVYDQATDLPLLSSRQIFLVCGVFTVPVFLYIIYLIPQASIRFLVWLASKTIYRIRVHGRENLPDEGGALLVSNHISWLDGVLLLLTSSRPIRIMVFAGNFKNRYLLWLANLWGAILIGSRPKEMVKSLNTAREALNNGELVCIFPEGGITRSGQIQGFKPGLMKILKGTDALVVPIYLDGLWGSIFSFERGKYFWKWPKKIPYPISIFFGPPIANPQDIHVVRRAVQDLGASAVRQRLQKEAQLARSFVRQCKRQKWKSKAADSSGADLSSGSLLARCLVLRRLLLRHVLAEDEKYVGVLLPPSVGGFVVNMVLALDRRIAVNLNYTVSSEVLNDCNAQCGVKHVLTSRKFMEKMDFQIDAELIYLEDFKDKPTAGDKLFSALWAYLAPSRFLERSLGLHKVSGDDILTVIFTSGSTGSPKGVMLTNSNVASNAEAIDQVVHLNSSDVIIGILPFFHSFGYTVTLWTVALMNIKGVYHFSPLDGRQVGKLCEKHKGTILLSTPTFLRTYLRRCEKEQFKTLDVAVTGAEKLPKELSDAFEKKFGFRPAEGYGTTELSPLVSVNVPSSRSSGNFQVDAVEGSVGRPVPGVSAKVLDLETGEELGAEKSGMLWIKGPNVMKGYLGREELTAEVIKDGWYLTGDVAFIDSDGFIHITGRESRFSKIGGEMVPHIQIEETLAKIIGADEEEGLKAAVASVPDPKKGERLIVLHTAIEQTPQQLRDRLSEEGLPNLFIPSVDSFHQVDELPVLGTGKLDLKGIRTLAMEKYGPSE